MLCCALSDMADKCKKCSQDIPHAKDSFKCADCSGKYHPQCLSSASSEAATKVSTRKNWKCEDCLPETPSTGGRVGGDRDSVKEAVLGAIAEFRKETNERLDQSHQKLDKMQDDIIGVFKEVGTLKEQYSEVKVLCTKNASDVEDLVSENKRLSDRVAALSSEVSDLQQHTRKGNILISGLPMTPRENVYVVLQRTANLLNIRYDRYDISAAHRLPVRKEDTRPPSIVVCFVSRNVKEDWIEARKARKTLSAQEFHPSFPDQQVFVNEHLTPQTRAIFNGARELMRTKKLAAVWTNDGRVLAKRTVTERPFRVLHLQHLEELRSQAPDTTDTVTPPASTSHNTSK